MPEAATGVAAWWRAVTEQRVAGPDHGDFYGLAREVTQVLWMLESLAGVLGEQVGGYGAGRRLYDNEGGDPAARVCEAVADLHELRAALAHAQQAANRFWLVIGRIGVRDSTDTPADGERGEG